MSQSMIFAYMPFPPDIGDILSTCANALLLYIVLLLASPPQIIALTDSWFQRAADVVFDSETPAPNRRNSTSTEMEAFEVDDSEQGLLRPTPGSREFRRVPQTSSSAVVFRPLRAVLTILTLPLRLISSILRFIFRILRIPFPQFVPFTWSNLSFYRPLGPGSGHDGKAMDPKSVAERWVRDLEEATGAVCTSRSGNRKGAGASFTNGHVASGADVSIAGPSALSSRQAAWEERRDADGDLKILPDFFLGSYEQFVRTCEKELKVGCIVLVSEEHDDVAEFKRSTLTDPTLVRLIQENDILVWGGDIRDKEPWSASQKLQATTYPFVAFIALQPRRTTGNGSSSTPTLTILSRHQGPSIPSTSAPNAPQTLVSHLNEQLLPRVTPFLARLRAQAFERERERALRAEQDRAFEESRRRDKERVEKRMEEERRAEQERRHRAEADERIRQEKARAEERRKAWEAHRLQWRRWGRRALITREPRPGEVGRGKTIRVGVRMPDGRRSVRFFGEADAVTALYAYVGSLFIPSEMFQDADPKMPPSNESFGEEGLVEEMKKSEKSSAEWWGFKLVLAYPRKEIAWEPAKKLGDVEALKGGGQVVVEMVGDVESSISEQAAGNGTESDGYETEE
ncbi:hypothetical protein AcV5_003038 [Taiwanofungus camphoratus]|nr:hypothetical protein AcV5_003038 [Antrodia cinnamomea]KAI0954287.1 hypothetical protein AcV7_007561 [Antrodia cinnamomea]